MRSAPCVRFILSVCVCVCVNVAAVVWASSASTHGVHSFPRTCPIRPLLSCQISEFRCSDDPREERTVSCDTALKGEVTTVPSLCCSAVLCPAGVSSTLGSVRGKEGEGEEVMWME